MMGPMGLEWASPTMQNVPVFEGPARMRQPAHLVGFLADETTSSELWAYLRCFHILEFSQSGRGLEIRDVRLEISKGPSE